jgi:NADPH:quinone reductase-like Zn-dependent oxidoreductase
VNDGAAVRLPRGTIPSMPQPGDTMHAVLLVGHGGPDMLVYRRDVPVPKVGRGEVLIAVRAAGVNNTDINTRIGWYSSSFSAGKSDAADRASLADGSPGDGSWSGAGMAFPRIQGADVCGVIVEVGDGVRVERLGERVIVQSCLRSLRRDGRDAWLGSEVDGGFAQFVRTPSADTYRVECSLSDVQLAAVPCSYATAENLLHRSGVGAGDRVLITGASGGVGSAAIPLAIRRGAEVIAIAGQGKAAAVRALGAEQVVRRAEDLEAAIGRERIDVVIDLVGGPRWPDLLAVLRPHGRYAVSGAIAGPIVELDLRTLYLKDLTLFGCTAQDDEVFGNLIGYLERGEVVPLVAATYPLEEIAQAQRDFEAKRHVGKLVLIVPPAG